MTTALTELQGLIRERYPDATFDIFQRDDPEGIRLQATVAHADTGDVLDVVIDRLFQFQVEDGLPIYVIPVRPPAEVAEELRTLSERPRVKDPGPLLRR